LLQQDLGTSRETAAFEIPINHVAPSETGRGACFPTSLASPPPGK
jgi:hypothetical protein